MIITKIKINDKGFKGATVSYLQEEERGGRKQLVPYDTYPKDPIHLGLERLFKDLRRHALDIYRIGSDDESVMAMYVNQTFIDTVEMNSEQISFSGQQEILDGKFAPLVIKKLQDADGYDKFDELRTLIDRIKEETELYVDKRAVVDEIEVAERFVAAGKAKGITIEDLHALSPDKLKNFATNLLESGFGMVVLGGEDIEVNGEMLEESIQELKTDFEAELSEDIIIPESEPKSKKKGKKDKVEKVIVSDESGNMSVAAGSPVDNEEPLF